MAHSIATKGDNQHNKLLHVIMVSVAIKSTMLSGVTANVVRLSEGLGVQYIITV
jgi:hypothetical protein